VLANQPHLHAQETGPEADVEMRWRRGAASAVSLVYHGAIAAPVVILGIRGLRVGHRRRKYRGHSYNTEFAASRFFHSASSVQSIVIAKAEAY
jgi:hypothetical protein